MSQPTADLRWHPFLRQWVCVAAHRQDRPQMPENWCPFCPGSGRVPDHYDVYLYPNDFAAFSFENDPYDAAPHGIFAVTGAQGACDVVLYSPEHTLLPSKLSIEQWEKVIALWTRRTEELFAKDVVQYVAVFENTGVEIGVTMPHPHGQIYAFPFIPPLVSAELESAAQYDRDHNECLYCKVLAAELADGQRIVAANEHFVSFLPFFGRFPTELHIYSRRHVAKLAALNTVEAASLASMLSIVRRKYDNLYASQMPLMMMLRQSPAHGDHAYFHFHIEFLPIRRSPTKLKYLAGIESGTGTFLNDTRAEQQAKKMREAEPVS
ncbi:MAG: galactose-1-phosphate uridylyltransferase [Acidobacteriaceae bacterium]|nr:galactose-1-phosphate uridylyltransferase [Acidobacteriaceae bacterium]